MSANSSANEPEASTAFCAIARATARWAASARAALRRAFFPAGNGAGAPSGPRGTRSAGSIRSSTVR